MSRGSHGTHGSISSRFYRRLLHLYPRAFRERFEAEMLALFAERAAAADRTVAGAAAFWRVVLGDLLRSAARERFPVWSWRHPMGELGYDIRQAWRTIARHCSARSSSS